MSPPALCVVLDRAGIARLVPHAGAMCLLDEMREWTPGRILCAARSHLDPANPLRVGGRLGVLAGAEYALQAAALHGALAGGTLAGGAPARPGALVALSGCAFHVRRLDDPAIGTLLVEAWPEAGSAAGFGCRFRLAGGGRTLLEGRGTVAFG